MGHASGDLHDLLSFPELKKSITRGSRFLGLSFKKRERETFFPSAAIRAMRDRGRGRERKRAAVSKHSLIMLLLPDELCPVQERKPKSH